MPLRALLPVPLLAALALIAPAAASATPTLAGTSPVSDTPGRMAQGFDGNDYVAIGTAKLGKIAPDGTVTEFPVTNGHTVTGLASGPITAGGPDNRIWLAYNGGVVAWDPTTNTGADFPIATINTAQGIAKDANGNLWVVDSADGLVEVAPNGTKIQDVAVAGSNGRDIALGSDGRMWWIDFNGLVHATTTTNPATTQDFNVGGNPQAIAAGPSGQLAFGNPGTNPQTVARISTTGDVQTTPAPASDPFGVAFGADGAYWFAQFNTQTLGRLTTDGTLTTPITFPAGSGPRRIAAGPNNTLFVALETTKQIARITGVDPPPVTTTTPPAGGDTTGTGTAGGQTIAQSDKRAPVMTRLTMTPAALRIGSSVATIGFTLDESGLVTVTIEKVRTGHRRAGKCRATGRGPKCTRYVKVHAFVRSAVAGANGLRFTGRVNGKALSAGSYRLSLVAADKAGNKSTAKSVRFRVSSGR